MTFLVGFFLCFYTVTVYKQVCVCVWGVQVKERAENLGSAFLHRGHSKTKDPHIGIFSQNRAEVSVRQHNVSF